MRFARKRNKIGGEGVGQICQEEVSEILEKQAKNGFSRVRSKVLVSKKCLNTAGRGVLSQSRILIFKNFPGVLLYPSLNMPLAIGIQQSHQNDLKSLYHHVHEMIQMATTNVGLVATEFFFHVSRVISKDGYKFSLQI